MAPHLARKSEVTSLAVTFHPFSDPFKATSALIPGRITVVVVVVVYYPISIVKWN